MKTLTNAQLAIYVAGQDTDQFVKKLGECLKIATESLVGECYCHLGGEGYTCDPCVELKKIENILETKK